MSACAIAVIGERPQRLGQSVQQRCNAGIITDLTSGHEEAERSTVSISDCVQFGVHASFGAADEPLKAPFMDGSPLN